ncbi:MAG: hypothetical protein Q8L24_02260 [bacterium]|nr:hypothetical protein [bacterium]
MNKLNPSRVGLVGGSFLGLWHLGWSILVAVGLAQSALDLILKLHFISPVFSIGDFNIVTAVILLVVTFVLGYIGGVVLAVLWNYLHR